MVDLYIATVVNKVTWLVFTSEQSGVEWVTDRVHLMVFLPDLQSGSTTKYT